MRFLRGGDLKEVFLPARKKIFRGFTLIELLIVIAILGILAAAVLVAANPGKRTKQARDSARMSDIGSISTALQAYYTTPGQGLYPVNGASECGADSGLTTLTSQGDLKQVPTDPKSAYYCYSTNGATSESATYITLEQPTSSPGTYVWCWTSTSGKAYEITTGACTP
ncbi:hypothetical protein A3B51_00315 [Candidatus Curtissbacteria bacterium RIFCSPLOWO2_01_FULL_41_18]|uniref:Type II secretion system protein GspG C-terminal domain-containing protein n=2 Tax=Candidatus Curtissiibacteriota TaxID=1752717 RepID=A0A1F5FY97_9BACT|nr:MAG: hypothetical protein A2696_03970 [Candidatus Curtissbacteria bacterium RIFCSPHIGHO2_01_FULL_41_13]OGE04624.1 MAG: hypothetical protein A3B51_00315 [Candidatus Curtissbacteria bacterium RIFCSPLOWO2_01_FULL_41_18]